MNLKVVGLIGAIRPDAFASLIGTGSNGRSHRGTRNPYRRVRVAPLS